MRRLRYSLLGVALLAASFSSGCCWFAAGAATSAVAAYSYSVNHLAAIEDGQLLVVHRAMQEGLKSLNIYVTREVHDSISARIEATNAMGQSILIEESVLTPRTTQIYIRVGCGFSTQSKSQAEAIFSAMDDRLSGAASGSQPGTRVVPPPISDEQR